MTEPAHKPEHSPRVLRWLKQYGFTIDPFAVYEADQERAVLQYLFVDRPYVARVAGDPHRPQSAFLLAERGAGKTATREMVHYECTHGRLRRQALPVRYNDFTWVLQQAGGDPGLSTAEHHVRAILRATLKALAEDVPPLFFDLLKPFERKLVMAYATEFASPLACGKLAQFVNATPAPVAWPDLSPVEMLEGLAGLVTQLGSSPQDRFLAVYVLVDRVDEMAGGPEVAAALLQPLVSESALLGMPCLAFKFFLPTEVGRQLQSLPAWRPDRLTIDNIAWDDEAMSNMLQARLAYYSQDQRKSLEEFCTTSAMTNIMRKLLHKSENSPRNLLRLCAMLVRCHVGRTEDLLLDGYDIACALSDFEQQLEEERALALAARTPIGSVRRGNAVPEQGLFLDDGDQVWIDGKPLERPLTPLERRLLRTLYRAAPAAVRAEQLIAEAWERRNLSLDAGLPLADEQNLRKLVTRLRQSLEPGERRGEGRFVRNVRGLGYRLNIH